MKNIIILFVALVSVSLFSTVNARVIAQTSVQSKIIIGHDTAEAKTASPSFDAQILADSSSEKFILSINNPLNEKLQITVKSNGSRDYSETTTLSTIRKRFDLTGAEDGFYTVTINNGKRSIVKRIVLSTSTQVVKNIAIQ